MFFLQKHEVKGNSVADLRPSVVELSLAAQGFLTNILGLEQFKNLKVIKNYEDQRLGLQTGCLATSSLTLVICSSKNLDFKSFSRPRSSE
jgi:hypothetical protein